MACKNCIHYDVCFLHLKGDEDKWCQRFKNKADFVEIVRCKGCKERNTEGCPMLHYVDGELIGHTEDDDFCSYGERKE